MSVYYTYTTILEHLFWTLIKCYLHLRERAVIIDERKKIEHVFIKPKLWDRIAPITDTSKK